MSLAEQNAAHAQKIIASAGPHFEALAKIADGIKLPTVAKILREQQAALAEDTFRLPVLGRFRNGKSTFLNALLCELTQPVPELAAAAGPLPAKDLPTTAKLTTIDYGSSAAVEVVMHEGPSEHWSLARFLRDAVIKRDPEENKRFFEPIREFKLQLPSKTLLSGITILDTPGTDDIRERTEIVEALLHKVDAAIVMLRSDALGGQDEREFIQSLADCRLTDLFFIVNRREGRQVDEDLKSEAWYRIAELCLGAARYGGQDLAEKNIFFVDAKAALNGRLSQDAEKLADSGLEAFEQRLSAYLEKNKRPAHVRRFVDGADAQAASLDASLAKLIPATRVKADEFKARYQALQPQLQEIRKRVNGLPKLVRGYRERAEQALLISFQDLINDLCRELPAEMAKQKIPSIDAANLLQRTFLPFQKKKILQETEAAARSIIQARLSAWRDNPPQKPGVQMVFERLMQEMLADVEKEVGDIKRKFDRLQVELGLSGSDIAETPDGWAKKIVLGAVALVWPDYAYNFVAGGMSGVVRGLAVHTGTAMIVLFFGGPFGWAVIAGTLASLVYGALAAPDQLKTKYRNMVCEKLIPHIRELPSQARAKLAEGLGVTFGKIEEALTDTMNREIAKEEETLREQMELANKSEEEKRKLLAALQHYRDEVNKCRAGLQDTLIAVDAGRL